MTGRSNTRFDPDADVTREELAVMIYRYLRFAGAELGRDERTTAFADMEEVSPWAKEAIDALQTAGIFYGRSDGRFDPRAKITRAETAAVFARLLAALGL